MAQDTGKEGGSVSAPVPFGKYLLLGRIGSGGMADVFLARPRNKRRLLAIKCMRKQLHTDQFVEMFIREGNLAVMLDHDAIVKTYEIGRVQGRHFICMEYISGVDLSLILRRAATGKRVPIPHALYVALRIFEGLHHAHELKDKAGNPLNLVNRDISPSNVRISFDGDVKLLDFGIAKATSALSSEIGMLKGKVSHMSPEQVRGLPLDRRSDIFSAAVVLFELLVLEKLFRGDSDFQLMDIVRKAEVPRPSALNPRVPPELDAFLLKALQRAPQDRFETADEAVNFLRDILAKYHFSKTELRDYVREVCHEEWIREQTLVDSCLSGDVAAESAAPSEEDYGEILDISIEEDKHAQPVASPVGSPRWMYWLLGFSVGLVVLAVVLLVVLRSR
jgi:eukaryotic-like serine/threonine-protein kinase